MARQIEDDVEYYYDSHPTEEDLMGETAIHAALVRYLMAVLTWLFCGQRCAIYDNLNFFQTRERKERPLIPDIAVIKGVDFAYVPRWRVLQTGRAPHVVFEIASQETWRIDLTEKPIKYAQMGVEEYFAYDPNDPPLRKTNPQRLFGWRLDKAKGVMVPLPNGSNGELWSFHLESFLVPEEMYLRLYDRNGQLRLTREEFEAMRAEAERRRADLLAEKLRSLGIDPDEL